MWNKRLRSGGMRGSRRLILALAALLLASCATAARDNGMIAFVHVTLITAYGEPHLQDQTVLVRDGRIVEVGPSADVFIPWGTRELGRPGQILAPGLVDMHVHLFDPDDALMFLANGVTTVRNMRGRPETTVLDARIIAGETPGPTIYSSTPIFDGPQVGYDNPRAVRTVADMRARIAEAANGYIGVKLYENLSREAFVAGVEEARAREMQIYAHVPFSMSLDEVLVLHIDSIEHLTGFDRALAPEPQSDWDEERWAHADMARLPALAQRVAESGVWNLATFVTYQDAPRAFADIDAAEAAPLYRYAGLRLRRNWRMNYDIARADRDPRAALPTIERAHAVRLRVIAALHAAHAPLLIGTDAPQPFVYPGFSLHDEFAYHREAGLSVSDILRIDTRDAAHFLHRDGEFGVIAVGARADLLLLDADPERELAVLRTPAGVMAAGRWYDAATLRRLMDDLAGRVAEAVAAR